jgi:hypothetical protein
MAIKNLKTTFWRRIKIAELCAVIISDPSMSHQTIFCQRSVIGFFCSWRGSKRCRCVRFIAGSGNNRPLKILPPQLLRWRWEDFCDHKVSRELERCPHHALQVSANCRQTKITIVKIVVITHVKIFTYMMIVVFETIYTLFGGTELAYFRRNHRDMVSKTMRPQFFRRRCWRRATALTVAAVTASKLRHRERQPPGNAWNENRNIAPVTPNRATTTGSAATPWKASIRATTPASTTNHA